jgi:hypothetical protein
MDSLSLARGSISFGKSHDNDDGVVDDVWQEEEEAAASLLRACTAAAVVRAWWCIGNEDKDGLRTRTVTKTKEDHSTTAPPKRYNNTDHETTQRARMRMVTSMPVIVFLNDPCRSSLRLYVTIDWKRSFHVGGGDDP